MRGQIVKSLSGFFTVRTESALVTCRARGRFKAERIVPLVGDLAEISVLEDGSGIIEESDFLTLLDALRKAPHVHLKGVFSHDGNSYSAPSVDACRETFVASQQRTLRFADIARGNGKCSKAGRAEAPLEEARGAVTALTVTEGI